MNYTFKKLVSNQQFFFDILPEDWQNEIVPYWEDYKDHSSIYVISENEEVIGGGIIFSICPPDLAYYKKEAQQWFDEGYLYLGFIWIAEIRRNKSLGSFWLNELKKMNPKQKYWLLIEEEHLHRFYQKNGFILNKSIGHNHQLEWLYVYRPL
ncbi:MAG: GNAT family N-acetyltransferase [Gelidibacter sp.]